MNIEIAERLRPFSSTPGTPFLLPGTSLRLKAYPAALVIDELSHSQPRNVSMIRWGVTGPVKHFAVTQDLEKGEVCVQGEGREGYFRYSISGPNAVIRGERTPQNGLHYIREEGGKGILLQKEEIRLIPEAKTIRRSLSPVERLSFGNHKKQDWDLIRRRNSFSEIFPLWHRIGQTVPHAKETKDGTAALLESCRKAIASGSPDTVLEAFNALYLAGFEGGLSPRLQDTDHHGIGAAEAPIAGDASSLYLVAEGARLIRSLFLQEKDGRVLLLPALPPEFSCGRLVNAGCGIEGQLSFEWTKKMMHKAVFAAVASQTIFFDFGSGEARCRLRRSGSDRGAEYHPGQVVSVAAGEQIWLDRFEK